MMDDKRLSIREKIARALVLGPAIIVSVAYIDPGNFGTNIAAGSRFGLKLLWVVWISGLMAIMFQYLAGKIGIMGLTVPDYVFSWLGKRKSGFLLKTVYFGLLFVMVLATDMAEFLGIALGLHLLLDIPLLIAVWISIIDVLILMIFSSSLSTLEKLVGFLVAIVGLSYLYELSVVGVAPVEVLKNSFSFSLSSSEEALVATSIIGATVMPHAVLLHSYLTKDKILENTRKVKEFLRSHLRETILFLSIASLINASLQIMSYYAFYKTGFNNIDTMEVAYHTLRPLFGNIASIIFGIAILASGISSSMVSVLSGVRLIESYVGKRFSQWKVRLAARLINMLPLAIAVYLGFNTIDILVYSQAALSMTLPLVLVPLIIISAKKKLMGKLVNNPIVTVVALISTILIIMVNLMLLYLE